VTAESQSLSDDPGWTTQHPRICYTDNLIRRQDQQQINWYYLGYFVHLRHDNAGYAASIASQPKPIKAMRDSDTLHAGRAGMKPGEEARRL
jgi:hypothetical protein